MIRDGAFVGEGCAISQASADIIMLDLVIGKETEEALLGTGEAVLLA